MVFVLNLPHACCTKPIKTWDEQILGKVYSRSCLQHYKWIIIKQRWRKKSKEYIVYFFYKFLKRWTVLHIFTCNVWPLSTENQKISKKSLKPSSQYSKNICISLDLKKLNFLSNILLAEINLKFQNFCISLDTKWLKENFWLCLKQYIEDTLFRMWDSLWKYFWTVVSNLDLFAVGSLSIPKHKLNIRRYLGLFFCDYSKLAIAKSLKICLVLEGENWAKKG